MIIQFIALLLAFSIRKVKIRGLDDFKYIGASTYFTSIAMTVVIVAFYSVKNMINVSVSLFSIGIQFGTTVVLALVFVPLVSQ